MGIRMNIVNTEQTGPFPEGSLLWKTGTSHSSAHPQGDKAAQVALRALIRRSHQLALQ